MRKKSRLATLMRKVSNFQSSMDQMVNSKNELQQYAEKAISALEKTVDSLEGQAGLFGLNLSTIRDALCSDMRASEQPWSPRVLGTVGDGPWDGPEFDRFLQNRGFEPIEPPHTSIDGLVVGMRGWSGDVLSRQIYDKDANSLRVYTQELFVVGLVLGRDPYDVLDQAVIEEVANIHPAIQFILHREFSWPWTASVQDSDSVVEWEEQDWNLESPLMKMGYSARADGPSQDMRRNVLESAFTKQDLLRDSAEEQRTRWGAAYSSQRLYAISHFINWLIGFQGGTSPDARSKWQSDLDWLKENFYKKTMRFAWPNVTKQVVPRSKSGKIRTANAAFMKNMTPSSALSALVGSEPLPRTEVVRKLWSYIKKHRLQDKVNTRMIIADDTLLPIFGKQQVSMFELAGLIGRHLK